MIFRHPVLIIDGTRVNDVRIYDDEITPCLKERMGTGGNNVPLVTQEVPVLMRQREGKPGGGKGPLLSENMSLTLAGGNDQVLFEPVLAFDGYNQSTSEDVYRALRIGIDSGDCIAIPIQDGREIEKKQNGLGIGQQGDPSYTLDQTGAQSVACTEDQEETTMQVRRLTPIECERLMGWPDNHTLPRADGKQNADTSRYKMCGNGVASPVAAWIGTRLMEIQNAPRDM